MAVGILSTGDELINGDVLNTTSCDIAHTLFSYNVPLSSQMCVCDDHESMVQAMTFLLDKHDVLIVTGGLGPTSDDRTRYAMGAYFDEPLVFHEPCWNHILSRHKTLGIETHENNRQQALFPQEAILFPNPYGTAYGCVYSKKNKTIYLLPGPPDECLPMFHKHALPLLRKLQDKQTRLYRWLLFGVPEAAIASDVEALLKNIDCETSYRWFYPYIEVKIKVRDERLTKSFFDKKCHSIFDPLIISPPDKTALAVLKEKLTQLDETWHIADEATHGYLENTLSTPGLNQLSFQLGVDERTKNKIKITGLSAYWRKDDGVEEDFLSIHFDNGENRKETKIVVSLRKSQVLKYVVELVAFHLTEWIDKTKDQ